MHESLPHPFRAGHRIRVEVSRSTLPRFDRNTNTGGRIAADGEADLVVADVRTHHDRDHPSHLIVPLIVHAGAHAGSAYGCAGALLV